MKLSKVNIEHIAIKVEDELKKIFDEQNEAIRQSSEYCNFTPTSDVYKFLVTMKEIYCNEHYANHKKLESFIELSNKRYTELIKSKYSNSIVGVTNPEVVLGNIGDKILYQAKLEKAEAFKFYEVPRIDSIQSAVFFKSVNFTSDNIEELAREVIDDFVNKAWLERNKNANNENE